MSPQNINPCVRDFFAEEDGTTAVEYAVMISLILATLIGSYYLLAVATKDSFDASSEAITGAFGN